ncbi:MAG TPA: regulator [Thermoplasmata archaeon]|nr:regulator [Thermoplasmata archaeon]
MWAKLKPHFKGYPAQERVAQLMMTHGLRMKGKHVYAGDIRIADSALARAVAVDRRVVTATLQTIEKTPLLRDFFGRLWPVCHLGNVAPMMGWGAIEILPTNASKPGILAGTSGIIAEAGISVRQVVVDDPEIVEDPRALLITEKPVPERLLPRIRNLDGVRGVVIR